MENKHSFFEKKGKQSSSLSNSRSLNLAKNLLSLLLVFSGLTTVTANNNSTTPSPSPLPNDDVGISSLQKWVMCGVGIGYFSIGLIFACANCYYECCQLDLSPEDELETIGRSCGCFFCWPCKIFSSCSDKYPKKTANGH